MSDEQTILHPTDLSPQSELAFAHAVRIAAATHSRLVVVHVLGAAVRNEPVEVPNAEALLDRWGACDQKPAPYLSQWDAAKMVEMVEIAKTNIVYHLLEYLDKHPVDMLVLATRARGGLAAWWHGSIAEPVARVSHTMTLFVPHHVDGFVNPDSGAVRLQNVVVPVVAQPHPKPALSSVRALARALGAADARLTMVHIGDQADAPMVREEGIVLLNKQGSPVVEGILDIVRERAADLVAMTTEGHMGVLDAFRGSTTEQILRKSNCPVLAVPAARER